MNAYLSIIKGIAKTGRPYFRLVIEDGINTVNVFEQATAVALALSGKSAEELVAAKEGVVACYELHKIKEI